MYLIIIEIQKCVTFVLEEGGDQVVDAFDEMEVVEAGVKASLVYVDDEGSSFVASKQVRW